MLINQVISNEKGAVFCKCLQVPQLTNSLLG